MAKYTYLLMNLGTLCAAFMMGRYWRQSWLAQLPRTTVAISTVALLFIIWDIVVTHIGHWSFNPTYTTGAKLVGLPLEEYLFFVVVGFASLAIWQKIQTKLKPDTPLILWLLCVPALLAVMLLVAWPGRGYTAIVAIGTLIVCVLLYVLGGRLFTLSWALYQGVLFALSRCLIPS